MLLEIQTLRDTSLGFQEVLKTLPQQVSIPADLLNWTRQVVREGTKAGVSDYNIQMFIKTKAIEEYYSHQQIEQTFERVKLELQGDTKKIAARYERISKN